MPVEMPRNRTRRRHSEIYLAVDYRSLCGIAPDELRHARERWIMAGEDPDVFVDQAAHWARKHKGSLAGFPPTDEPV